MPIDNPGEAPTKEFFVPVLASPVSGSTFTASLPSGMRCNAIGESADTTFFVPADFNSIIDAVIYVIPAATQAAADWDILSDYGAVGEALNIHSEADAASTYNVVNNQNFEVDISGILSVLAAGDYVGVRITCQNAAHPLIVCGVRFRYR